MKLLEEFKSRYVVAIDIETVRIEDKYDDLPEHWQSAWEYKNKQDGEIPDFEELSDLWVRKASLYAEFLKICAVSIVFMNDDESLFCKEFYGDNESEILEGLSEYLERMLAANKTYRLVGHASKFYDYPILSKRYLINGIAIPTILDTAHLKPWENTNLCTNEIWRCGGTGAGSSLQALCTALELPVSKVDLVGDEVGAAYYRGEYKRIGTYCSYDTIATFNVIRKLKGEKVFQFDEVEYLDQDQEKIEDTPILKAILNRGKILAKEYKELEKVAKELDPSEIPNYKRIIQAALSKKEGDYGVKEIALFEKLDNLIK